MVSLGFRVIAWNDSQGHHTKEKLSWAAEEQDPRSYRKILFIMFYLPHSSDGFGDENISILSFCIWILYCHIT